jgi:hypothetical protein
VNWSAESATKPGPDPLGWAQIAGNRRQIANLFRPASGIDLPIRK